MTGLDDTLVADPDASDEAAEWRQRVKGTNICDASLLATDYLNHFNEVVMLIGMIPDMPECLDDVREWRPKSYTQHFADSGLPEADLAIAAYQHSPDAYRLPLEAIIGNLDRLVDASVKRIAVTIDAGNQDAVADTVGRASRDLQRLVDAASAIINGTTSTIDQTAIDDMFES